VEALLAAIQYGLLLIAVFIWRKESILSGKAVVSFVLAFLSFSFSLLAGIPAIVLGVLGIRDVRRGAGRQRGKGLAIAAILVAIVDMVGPPVALMLALPQVRLATAKKQSSNNLKMLSLAMLNYESVYGELPPPVLRSPSGQLYSWRVALLPYLGESELYDKYNKNEPWDSPTNRAFRARMPKVYAAPGKVAGDSTFYQVVVGRGTAFEGPDVRLRLERDFPKGLANTLLIVEAGTPVPWTKPEDVTYEPGRPIQVLGGIFPDGFHVAFVDGLVRWVEKKDAGQVGEWVLRTK
jgi:hypothetical protein